MPSKDFKLFIGSDKFSCIYTIIFTFCHKGGVICISEVVDTSPGHLDPSLCTYVLIYTINGTDEPICRAGLEMQM